MSLCLSTMNLIVVGRKMLSANLGAGAGVMIVMTLAMLIRSTGFPSMTMILVHGCSVIPVCFYNK